MMILVIRRNIDKVSGFPDIVLGDIYYMHVDAKEPFSGYQSKSEILTFTSPLKMEIVWKRMQRKINKFIEIKVGPDQHYLLKGTVRCNPPCLKSPM